MVTPVAIGSRLIGGEAPCFVIAEAGVNHNGDVQLALDMIDAATACGADAVKFQTFCADSLVTSKAPKASYQRGHTNDSETQYEILKRLELDADAHRRLVERCCARGIMFMSSAFDEGSIDLLDELGVAVYKVPSGEIDNSPYLTHVAGKGKPIILSTGMSTLDEVSAAVDVISNGGHPPVIILHCVSCYPALPTQVNLRALQTLEDAFNVPIGFSDHTLGIAIALAAAARGAAVIEKHITLDRSLVGPDHHASVEPDEFALMVDGVRAIESALGDGRKMPAAAEAETAAVARKSLVAAHDIAAGTVLEPDHLVIKRPGTGLSPTAKEQVIGRRSRVLITSGTPLRENMLE